MADGRDTYPASSPRSACSWTEIFRCFQIALDPRKLLVAAARHPRDVVRLVAPVAASSTTRRPTRTATKYSNIRRPEGLRGEEEPRDRQALHERGARTPSQAEAKKRFDADHEQWQVLDELAGPGGRLRTLPWYEYRGPNPFLFVTDLIELAGRDVVGAVHRLLRARSRPVLLEPLVKLLLPVAKIVSPGVSPLTRLYLFLILLCERRGLGVLRRDHHADRRGATREQGADQPPAGGPVRLQALPRLPRRAAGAAHHHRRLRRSG